MQLRDRLSLAALWRELRRQTPYTRAAPVSGFSCFDFYACLRA